jgi:hypothetical protein
MLDYACYEKQLEPSDLVSSRNGKWIGHATAARELKALRTLNTIQHRTARRSSKGTLRELGPKRLELMREVMPRAAILVNPTNSMETTTKEAQACAPDGHGQCLARVWQTLVHPALGSVYRTLPSFRSYNIILEGSHGNDRLHRRW